jgi:hypothetical protein
MEFLKRGRPNNAHQPILIECDAPGVLDVWCACGAGPANTPWGEPAAAEIFALHLFMVGAIKSLRPLDAHGMSGSHINDS